MEGTTEHKIVMRKPDGTVTLYGADDTLSDADPDTISYTITDPELLDQRGRWEYWGQLQYWTTHCAITYDRFGFWVT